MTDYRIGGQIEMMYTGRSNIKVFSCNSNPELAKAIAKESFPFTWRGRGYTVQ